MNYNEKSNRQICVKIKENLIHDSQFFPGNLSEYLRDVLLLHNDNRHKLKFMELNNTISSEINALQYWKDKGHPCGEVWTPELNKLLNTYINIQQLLNTCSYNQ